jgi:hypothetical protein
MLDANIERSSPNVTQSLLKVLESDVVKEALLENAIQLIDEYLNAGSEESIFKEPAYMSKYGGDLNAFLKWEQFGKTDESSPRYRRLLGDYQRTMKRRSPGQASPFEVIVAAITD